ncbi:uncharacterized protein ACR2FA_002162 [Aphomia sociella]
MSVIGIRGIPKNWTIKLMMKILAKYIRGQFIVLNDCFEKGKPKVAYLKLSEFLDPHYVVESLNNLNNPGCRKLWAYIPDHIPKMSGNALQMNDRVKHRFGIPTITDPNKILVSTHKEIMRELQYKYTHLYALSAKYGHKLLTEIARTVFQWLKLTQDTVVYAKQSCFYLGKFYRKKYYHSRDFNLILSTLHAVQDGMGVPRTKLKESDLYPPPQSVKPIMPFPKVEKIRNRYSDTIARKITEHINGLVIDEAAVTEEDKARKEVRQQLKNLLPYVPLITRQVITDNFDLTRAKTHQEIRIYWEPYMPAWEVLNPFLGKFQTKRVTNSDRFFNILRIRCPLRLLDKMLAHDGTVLGDTKMTIRIANRAVFPMPQSFIDELKMDYGIDYVNDPVRLGEEYDDEWEENHEGEQNYVEEENDGERDGEDANMDENVVEDDWQEPWE